MCFYMWNNTNEVTLTLFRMTYLPPAGGGGGSAKMAPSLKSVTHILQWWNMAQLYLTWRWPKKYMNHVTLPPGFCLHQHFLSEISNIRKYRYRFHFCKKLEILLTFFEYLKKFLINVVTILIMPAKLATLGLLKIKIFWSKGYDVIIPGYDVTDKIDYVTYVIS